jgi:hypothetical protein
MHPAKEGFSALPFFDEFDLSTVDVLLISQYVFPSFFAMHEIQSLGKCWSLCAGTHIARCETSVDLAVYCWNLSLWKHRFFPWIYMSTPIQFECHANIPCTPVPFELLNLSALCYFPMTVTVANGMLSIVSTSTTPQPFHMFSAKPTSKAESL